MNAEEQKKAKILGLLILIAGLTWYLVYRLSPETPAVAAAPAAAARPAGTGKAPISPSEAAIRLDLLEQSAPSAAAGRRNLFQYRPKPVPPPKVVAAPPPVYVPPVTTISSPPPPPPQPQMRPFRYESWIKDGNGKIIAAQLIEGGNVYQAKEGEVLLGQYRIVRVTESLVEIEDTVLKRRQTFPKVQQ
jgi:hypothetical protein